MKLVGERKLIKAANMLCDTKQKVVTPTQACHIAELG